MTIDFIVDGKVVPKGRPRTTHFNGHIHAYTPRNTKLYEDKVRAAYSAFKAFLPTDYIKMSIDAYYQIPKSTSKARKEAMLIGRIRPVTRPDLDNVAKTICDALNGIAYKDDSQIVSLTVNKYYSDWARAEIRIQDVKW